MARGRMISKTLSTSQKRAALHQVVPDLAEFCQQLYPLLVSHADDFGRQQGDAFTVKHAIDPTSPRSLTDFERALRALDQVDLIRWYEVEGRQLIQIVKFDPHQPGLHKRTTSIFPEPPGDSRKVPESPSQESLGNSVIAGTPGKVPEIPSEGKGREENRTEGKGTAPAPPARPVPLVARRRGNAAFEGPRGLYVPQRLHEQFVSLRNHAGAERELLAWYGETCEDWFTGARKGENPDPDMFKFWNARYGERWPASGPGAKATPADPSAALAKKAYGGMEFGR